MRTTNIDDRPLTFGKYKGQTPNQIAEYDPGYIVWMYETVAVKHCSAELYNGCRQDFEEEHNWLDERDFYGDD